MKSLTGTAIKLFFLPLLIGLITIGYGFGETLEIQEKAADQSVVATVNGVTISADYLDREIIGYQQRLKAQRQPVAPADDPAFREKVLDELVSRELVYQESQKKGIKVSSDEIDKIITDIKQRYPDEKTYQSVLQKMNVTEDGLRKQLAHQSAIQKFIEKVIVSQVSISDEENKKFYDENPQYFRQPEMVHARHILIKVPSGATDNEKADALKKIEGIKKKADSGEDFGELAKTESQGPSAPKGGDLGFFGRGRMVPPFEEAAFALKIKEISGVVETNFGYHLIQVLDRKDARMLSFEEVEERIAGNLKNMQVQNKLNAYISELRQPAKIEIK